jgi:molybdate/tungstate transport system substrate-binding protein
MVRQAKVILAIAIIAVIIVSGVAYYMISNKKHKPVTITVCSAGSLGIPLSNLSEIFHKEYEDNVRIKTAGSVQVVRSVTELGWKCDVVAVADYRVIPMFMVPKYTDWYVAFATNQIVLAFTDHSKYASWLENHPNKWYVVLDKPGVRYGFSNPDMDPCGYRSVGVLALASLYYGNETILKEYVLSKISGSRAQVINGTLHVYIPATFSTAGNIIIKPKEVDLVALLESGSLDYAFEYESVAKQHGLKYIELPKQVNLGDPALDNIYGRVVVHILVGSNEERNITMKSIVYGVTIPRNAPHPKAALEFVRLLLSSVGRKVFEENGQPFLKHPVGYGRVPEGLRKYVVTTGEG